MFLERSGHSASGTVNLVVTPLDSSVRIGVVALRQSRLASVLATCPKAVADRVMGKRMAWQGTEGPVSWVEVHVPTGGRKTLANPVNLTASEDEAEKQPRDHCPPAALETPPAPLLPPARQDSPPSPSKPYPETINPFMPKKAIATVIRLACLVWEVSEYDLLGKRRIYRFARPRSAVYSVLREMGMSFPKIGLAVGGRDNSTARSGSRRLKHHLKLSEFANKYKLFRGFLGLEPRSPDASL